MKEDVLEVRLGFLKKIKVIFYDIKIQHTVFALPFAVISAFLAAEGLPEWWTSLWILIAMFCARNGAMAFNRIVDAKLDKLNPRTSERALSSGKVDVETYWIFFYSIFNHIYICRFYVESARFFSFTCGIRNCIWIFFCQTFYIFVAFMVGYSYFNRACGSLGCRT